MIKTRDALKGLATAAFLVGLAMLDSKPVSAAGPPGGVQVMVVNDATTPVPVLPQGTTTVAGTVNIGNVPTVTLAGNPVIALAGTPTVTLSPGATVSVGGTVLVRDSDDPVRNGHTVGAQCTDRNQRFTTCQLYTVPNNQRFVVESVSAFITVDHGLPVIAELYGSNGFVTAVPCQIQGGSFVEVSVGGPFVAVDLYACHVLTRGYVDPGDIAIAVTSNNEQNIPQFLERQVSLTGYTVSMP
jgi:hypothetical protein